MHNRHSLAAVLCTELRKLKFPVDFSFFLVIIEVVQKVLCRKAEDFLAGGKHLGETREGCFEIQRVKYRES